VSKVFTFDSGDELRDLIKEVNPEYLVVGSEYQERGVIGGEHAGEIVFFPRIPEYSTTNILNHGT
jgi:bifunctional ADP-heptose synthase (sugar kinase/adenylyltransferase)